MPGGWAQCAVRTGGRGARVRALHSLNFRSRQARESFALQLVALISALRGVR